MGTFHRDWPVSTSTCAVVTPITRDTVTTTNGRLFSDRVEWTDRCCGDPPSSRPTGAKRLTGYTQFRLARGDTVRKLPLQTSLSIGLTQVARTRTSQ